MCNSDIDNLLYNLAELNQITVKKIPLIKGLYGLLKGNRIAIKSDMSETKQIYTLAHELAHYYLHFDKGNTIESCKYSDYEEQANRAAIMLLDFMKVLKKTNAALTDQSNSCID